jgi:hypothetical protein
VGDDLSWRAIGRGIQCISRGSLPCDQRLTLGEDHEPRSSFGRVVSARGPFRGSLREQPRQPRHRVDRRMRHRRPAQAGNEPAAPAAVFRRPCAIRRRGVVAGFFQRRWAALWQRAAHVAVPAPTATAFRKRFQPGDRLSVAIAKRVPKGMRHRFPREWGRRCRRLRGPRRRAASERNSSVRPSPNRP